MKKILPIFVVSAMCAGLANAGKVYVNHLGFMPHSVKKAVYVNASGAGLTLRNTTDSSVVKILTPSEAKLWKPSNELACIVDFSDVTAEGVFAVYEGDNRISEPFRIGADVYIDLIKSTLKWYYYQRASVELPSRHAGIWAREAGHPDDCVLFYPERVGFNPVSCPKGWYDAGDYGKYIVNSGITVYTLLALYRDYQPLYDSLRWNIPEDGNLPDLLAEIKWNLEWMLSMQDSDGGVYHKLTTGVFCGSITPAEDTAQRYIVMKTTAASYDFAAVTALASEIYAPYDEKLSTACKHAAVRAFEWAENNPKVYYTQPAGMNTGEYGDRNVNDERMWAAVSMALVDSAYRDIPDEVVNSAGLYASAASWQDVVMLGFFEIVRHPEIFGEKRVEAARASLLKSARLLLNTVKNSGYGLSMTENDFIWGSNSVIANQAILMLHAYYLTHEREFVEAAQSALDYILGRNPLGMSFVTGFGNKSPEYPHHRPSESDKIAVPIPGMVVGGPNAGGQDVRDGCRNYVVADKPALSYIDAQCSYASNETAINWNAPLAYLAGALYSLNMKNK
ncbi:MAG: glycoside hydrolase family 9 protein [Prevotellaceae bacterium]|jgi:endoglucanase|nr:glycoside hydrolase family 9 protein [Prevotellaceae bacterium]